MKDQESVDLEAAVLSPVGNELTEVWRPVPGFDGWYDASDWGRVRSWRTRAKLEHRSSRPRLLAGRKDRGYRQMKLSHPVLGKVKVAVHHLVLATFVRSRPSGLVCDHINADRCDNRVENLRWVTPRDNIRHAAALGRMNVRPGARSHSPLSVGDVREIRRLRQSGARLRLLAERFGVSESTVSRIGLGRGWKEVV